MARNDRTELVLLAAGLALGALGQYYLIYRRQYVWDGALFWLAGIGVLTMALVRARRAKNRHGRGRRREGRWLSVARRHPGRAALAAGGAGLSVAAGFWSRALPADAGFAAPLAAWALGTVSFVSAFLPAYPGIAELWRRGLTEGGLRRWVGRHRGALAGLVLLFVAALLVRAYDLEHIPANLGGDEGAEGAEALELVRAPLGNPFSTGWLSVPTMSFLASGVSMRVFGASVGGLRTLSAVVGTATVLTTFLLAQELWSRRVAWVSASLLAFGHYHVHFSRLGSNQVGDALFASLALWLLVRALRTKRHITFAAAGAVAGLGWYAYFGARLVGVVIACYVGLQAALGRRFLDRYGRQLAILVAAALVVMAPLLLHYAAHPEELASRPRQVSVFASGWLAREREITGRSTLSLLLQQFWKSISAFNYTLDSTFWYRASIPLLDAVSGLLFVVGLIWVTGQYQRPASQLLLIWFWLALLLGWMMTENPPSSQRMVIAAPALALFAGLGLDWVGRRVESLFDVSCVFCQGLLAIVVAASAAINLRYYFLTYTPTRVYGNPTAEMTTVLARHLNRQGEEPMVFLHGAPHVYWGHGTLRFMAREIAGQDVAPPEEGQLAEVDASRGARFVFHPERLEEMSDVQERYPGGEETTVHSGADGRLLYAMYEVGP